MNANCVSFVVLQYKVKFRLYIDCKTVSKNKTANYKSFLAFFKLGRVIFNFRKIEPTVSYNLFLIKKTSVLLLLSIMYQM